MIKRIRDLLRGEKKIDKAVVQSELEKFLTAPGAVEKSLSGHSLSWLIQNGFKNAQAVIPELNPVLYRCIQIISDNIIEAPLKFKNIHTEEDIQSAHPIVNLFNTPDYNKPYSDFISRSAVNYSVYGESFWFFIPKAENEDGTVSMRLINLHPKCMYEMLDPYTHQIRYWIYNPDTNSPKPDDSGNMNIPPEFIIHIKNGNPSNYMRGLSALDVLENPIAVNHRAMEFEKSFLNNGAAPNLVMTQDQSKGPTENNLKKMRAMVKMFDKRHTGDNVGKTGILAPGLAIEKVGLEHDKMQFLEILKYTNEQVMMVMGINKTIIGDSIDLNRALADTQKEELWKRTLKPMTNKFASAINYQLIRHIDPNIEAYYDYSKLLPEQILEVKDIPTLLSLNLTPNQINERLGLGFDPTPEMDEVLVPFNMVPLKDLLNENVADTPTGKMLRQVMQNEIRKALGTEKPIEITDVKKKYSENTIEKSLKAKKSMVLQILRLRRKHEKILRSKIKRYGNEQKAKVLNAFFKTPTLETGKSLDETDSEILKALDLNEREIIASIESTFDTTEDIRLQQMMDPVFTDIIEEAGQMANDLIQSNRTYILDRGILDGRLNMIKDINQTILDKLKKQIHIGVAGIENDGKQESVNKIAKRLRSVYQELDGPRSKLIAQTETNNLVSEATLKEYTANGVKTKAWITVGDSKVRESHRRNQAQGYIPVNETFSSGEMYPSEPRCRCTIIPGVE